MSPTNRPVKSTIRVELRPNDAKDRGTVGRDCRCAGQNVWTGQGKNFEFIAIALHCVACQAPNDDAPARIDIVDLNGEFPETHLAPHREWPIPGRSLGSRVVAENAA